MRQYKLDLRKQLEVLNENFDLNKPASPENAPLRPGDKTIAQVLSQVMQMDTENDAVKFWSWAVLLHGGGVITLDQSDFDLLRNFAKKHKSMISAVKGQIEEAFRLTSFEEPK